MGWLLHFGRMFANDAKKIFSCFCSPFLPQKLPCMFRSLTALSSVPRSRFWVYINHLNESFQMGYFAGKLLSLDGGALSNSACFAHFVSRTSRGVKTSNFLDSQSMPKINKKYHLLGLIINECLRSPVNFYVEGWGLCMNGICGYEHIRSMRLFVLILSALAGFPQVAWICHRLKISSPSVTRPSCQKRSSAR